MKLQTTKNYLFLVDEEAEIKNGDWIYLKSHSIDDLPFGNEIGQRIYNDKNPELFDDYYNMIVESSGSKLIANAMKIHTSKIIAYYPLTKEAKELEEVPLLPIQITEETTIVVLRDLPDPSLLNNYLNILFRSNKIKNFEKQVSFTEIT